MTPELGLYSLILALVVSVAQSVLPLIGAAKGDARLMAAGTKTAYLSFALVVAAFAALTYAHITDDFSVLNVAMNSHTLKPMLYKFSGVWGSHEGSMLLWVLMLTAYGAAMAFFMRTMPADVKARALAVQGMMGVGFIAFVLFTSNPFERLFPVPLEGHDLNPLLQDPGLAFHPPFLYFGYVGFSSLFSLAAALLLSDWSAAAWAKAARPWALLAWSSLTLGIAMGSWWAYYELGWGGWWFWDPVENAALMPWLAGTALLHSLLATWQRAALSRWTILLSIITFSLSLLGTFLVRSGVLTSVHSFASDPTRGIAILMLLMVAIGGALGLYAARASKLPISPMFGAISRESAMLVNNLLLCAACATVLTGTLYPMLLDALTGGIVSVGAPYFNMTVLPLFILMSLSMATGPLLRWRQGNMRETLSLLRGAFLLSVFAAMVTLYVAGFKSVLGLLAIALGVWVIAGAFVIARKNGSIKGVVLAHAGLGITILGMAGSALSSQYIIPIKLHETVVVDGYHVEFISLDDNVQGPNYVAERGVFKIEQGNRYLTTATPERRFYPSQSMTLSNVSIHTNLLRDVYVVMSDDGEKETDANVVPQRTLRLQINPLVPWIWLGAVIMAAGGVSAMWPRRVVHLVDELV